MNNRARIFLSAAHPQLVGKYNPGHEHIHVICNDTQDFTFALPDLGSAKDNEFIVYNIGTGAVTVTGKAMSTGSTSHVLNTGDTVTFVSDLKSMWLLSDANSLGSLAADWRAIEESGTSDLVFQKDIGGTWTEKNRLF